MMSRIILKPGFAGSQCRLHGHEEKIMSVSFSRDGLWVATSSEDETIILWNAIDGSIAWELHGPCPINVARRGAGQLAFSPDSKYLASYSEPESAYQGGMLMVYMVASGDNVSETLVPDGKRQSDPRFVVWAPKGLGGILSVVDHAGIVMSLYDTAFLEKEARLLDTLGGHDDDNTEFYTEPCFSHDDDKIRLLSILRPRHSSSGDPPAVEATSQCCVWDFKPSVDYSRTFPHGVAETAAFSPVNSDIVVIIGPASNRLISLWNIETDSVITCLGGSTVNAPMVLSPDWTQVVTVSPTAQSVVLRDISSGAHVLSLEGHTECITQVAMSPDGEYIAAASLDQTIRLWKARGETRSLAVFTEHGSSPISHLTFSVDGGALFSCAQDGSVCIRPMREIIPFD